MNIVFRKIKESDLETIRNWRMLPEVTKYMYTNPQISQEDQEGWYRKISADPTRLCWILQVDGVDIGFQILDIDRINRRATSGRYIAETSMRGKGIGNQLHLNMLHYVFDILNLNKVCGETFAWNKRNISLHQKFGSKIEGRRRAHIYKNGQFEDIVEMAILKDEWEQAKKDYTRIPAVFEE